MPKINLIYLQTEQKPVEWHVGSIYTCAPEVKALSSLLKTLVLQEKADAWLLWDAQLPLPEEALILELLNSKADIWHAGLSLGLAGKPEWLDFVSPTWMLNRDPDAAIEATSWRLSLRAALIRSEVLLQLGGPCAGFRSLEGCGLELGYRYIRRGAILRYVPSLHGGRLPEGRVSLPLGDQLLFIQGAVGKKWTMWAGFRALLSGSVNPLKLLPTALKTRRREVPPKTDAYKRIEPVGSFEKTALQVSVLIPTLKRYPYLKVLLGQLRAQTIKPLEILVIDQTPASGRDIALPSEFQDLPLRWYYLDQPGQCSSRNFGLQHAKGEAILFLDDDEEIPANLIEQHLAAMGQFECNVSNGVVHEIGIGSLPPSFQLQRISDVFPAGNTLVRNSALKKSGLFDLAFDHGQRADHDLGMRLYLSGELLMLNPQISILHHHASIGGLREHKARVSTFAASRTELFNRQILTVSDLYLEKRYFSPRQVREAKWINIAGTFSLKGPTWKKALKVLIALVTLPRNLHQLNARSRMAEAKLNQFPQIPTLQEERSQ